jgi:hypothetical protein
MASQTLTQACAVQIQGVHWAHMDIAGPAMYSKPRGAMPKGGTGFGVQVILIRYIVFFRFVFIFKFALHRGFADCPLLPCPCCRRYRRRRLFVLLSSVNYFWLALQVLLDYLTYE